MTNDELRTKFIAVLREMEELFTQKNNNYKSADDPFMNFTQGGLLRHGDGSYKGRYEALKDYETKHIVTALNNDINFAGLRESLRDIAVYNIIAMIMADEASKKFSVDYFPCKEKNEGEWRNPKGEDVLLDYGACSKHE